MDYLPCGSVIIAVEMSRLCEVLSQSLRRKEPPFAECIATINRIEKGLLYNYLACQLHDIIIQEAYFMINYRKILEIQLEEVSQRTISQRMTDCLP